ncbi:hypothetical protein PR048_003339 [Dryococelus australis]|uniref:Uncharacterized protein n=1 Tax=Dryococelus australis TaxID=614101 RepID=A0ABQ9IMU0_9NEOP|nr:hypothetical protein PR048_003339 [Dryococelus australis]
MRVNRNTHAGRPRYVGSVRLEEVIHQHINDVPSTSTRSIARRMGVLHSTTWDVLWLPFDKTGHTSSGYSTATNPAWETLLVAKLPAWETLLVAKLLAWETLLVAKLPAWETLLAAKLPAWETLLVAKLPARKTLLVAKLLAWETLLVAKLPAWETLLVAKLLAWETLLVAKLPAWETLLLGTTYRTCGNQYCGTPSQEAIAAAKRHGFLRKRLDVRGRDPATLLRRWGSNEVRMEQRRNERAEETGGPRENPSTSGIVRHDSDMRKSASDPAGD